MKTEPGLGEAGRQLHVGRFLVPHVGAKLLRDWPQGTYTLFRKTYRVTAL